MTPGELANLLLHRRKALGLSLREAGRRSETHFQAIHTWEAGHSLDQVAAWLTYCESLGIELRVSRVVRPKGTPEDAP